VTLLCPSGRMPLVLIPLSFITLLLPVVIPVLIHIFNHIFVNSEIPGKWKTSVVLPIPNVRSPAKFSDYRPISLLVCLSKVFEVLMARQMERHIRCNNLLAECVSIWISSAS
jgi:hypothetical protein